MSNNVKTVEFVREHYQYENSGTCSHVQFALRANYHDNDDYPFLHVEVQTGDMFGESKMILSRLGENPAMLRKLSEFFLKAAMKVEEINKEQKSK
ncbi:MAG: hypothetical protein RL621_315 [Bacteroidota bacterium]|jgi:hypothetical protein